MLVLPLYSFGEDAAICCSLVRVSGLLVERVRGLELSPVMSVAISDHDLRGVLVGHDHSGARESAAMGIWIVRLKGLPGHASMQVHSLLEGVPVHNKISSQELTVMLRQ